MSVYSDTHIILEKYLEERGFFKPHLLGVVRNELLYRLWKHLESDKDLVILEFGIYVIYRRTSFGIMQIIAT